MSFLFEPGVRSGRFIFGSLISFFAPDNSSKHVSRTVCWVSMAAMKSMHRIPLSKDKGPCGKYVESHHGTIGGQGGRAGTVWRGKCWISWRGVPGTVPEPPLCSVMLSPSERIQAHRLLNPNWGNSLVSPIAVYKRIGVSKRVTWCHINGVL